MVKSLGGALVFSLLGLTAFSPFHHLGSIPPKDIICWERRRAMDRPHGVFATRYARRPNPIALTVVELLCRQAPVLRVRGIDMLDRNPILDINVPHERRRRGWLAKAEART